MISFPIVPVNKSFANIFNGVTYYQVVTWNGTSYVTPTAAEAGCGYWALVLTETTLNITDGVPTEQYEKDLPAGWSMIGSVNGRTVASGAVFSGFYQLMTWTGTSYVDAKAAGIEPGKGYWTLVLNPTHITIA